MDDQPKFWRSSPLGEKIEAVAIGARRDAESVLGAQMQAAPAGAIAQITARLDDVAVMIDDAEAVITNLAVRLLVGPSTTAPPEGSMQGGRPPRPAEGEIAALFRRAEDLQSDAARLVSKLRSLACEL